MNSFFQKDSVFIGVVVTLGSELAVALLLYVGMTIAGVSVADHVRWFFAVFIVPVLLLRYYVKKKNSPVVMKTIITLLFLTFLIFMVYVFRIGAIAL